MIAIVTDSTADLPDDLVERFGITVIPAVLVVEGRAYEDGTEMSREEFYARLPEMDEPPTTSAPSSGTFQAAYEACYHRGADYIVSLHVASSLSAIVNAAEIAAKAFEGRITVLDSGQLSLGLGFQVLAAAEAAQAGKDLQGVLEAVQVTRRRLQVVAMLDTLEYLHRGGRVSLLQARIGAVLRVRLFIELHEGKINFLEQVRTRGKAVGRLWETIVTLGPLERFALLHANAEEEARLLLQQLGPDLPADSLLVNVNTVIGTHVGPGALGFAAVMRR